MGLQDRPYFQNAPTPGSVNPIRDNSPASIATWLMIINVAVFLLEIIVLRNPRSGESAVLNWGAFTFGSAVTHLQLWRFLSFQFLHADLGHLVGNMLGIFVFGAMVEKQMGPRRFLAYYLLCGVAGAVGFILLKLLGIASIGAGSALIGASAGVFGILVAAAVIAPDQYVYIVLPPMPVKLRTMAILLLIVAAWTVFDRNGSNRGGEAAHLGGAAFGWLLFRNPWLLGWVDALFGPREPRMRIRYD